MIWNTVFLTLLQKDLSGGCPGRTYCALRTDIAAFWSFLSAYAHTSACVCWIYQAPWQTCLEAAGGVQNHHCELHRHELVDIAVSHISEKQNLMSLVGHHADFQDMSAVTEPILSRTMWRVYSTKHLVLADKHDWVTKGSAKHSPVAEPRHLCLALQYFCILRCPRGRVVLQWVPGKGMWFCLAVW